MTEFARCIVHAGTHKTGTTTVQELLAEKRVELAAAGFHYPCASPEIRDHNPLAHRLATCGEAELPGLQRELLRGWDGPAAPSLLLSAEEFSTRICRPDAFEGFDDGAYWAQRSRYLQRLKQVLPPAPVEVFVCFRDHESYAHALYATKVLSGRITWRFGDFVRHCAPIFDYRRQAEVLAQGLGPLRAERFERLRDDLANRLFAWMGLPLRVGHTPRLRPTPTLDLIHWLARTAAAPSSADDQLRRATFCRNYTAAAGREREAVHSLWSSEHERRQFLDLCSAPPLDDWPAAPDKGRIPAPQRLAQRADEIETEYRQWLQQGGRRKHWMHFWRRR